MFSRAALRIRAAAGSLHPDAGRLTSAAERLFLAVHPRTIRRTTIEFRHTYYLGIAAVSIWLAQLATGALMMFHLTPAVPDIYRDVEELQFAVAHGALIRSLHYWGASAMVAVVVLHLLRVFFQRGYRAPRRATWAIGVGLFILTFLSAHTGYLLPWDQRAFWGIEIVSRMAAQMPLIGEELRFLMLGGNTIGANAVLRVYVLHCFVMPAAMALLVAGHLFSIRTTSPTSRDEDQIDAFPHLLARELLVFQWVVIALVSLALIWEAPLEELANPLLTPDPVKAPWYLVGLQELMHYFPPLVAGMVVPGLVVVVLIVVPFIDASWRPPLGGTFARGVFALALGAPVVLLAAAGAWVALVPTLAIELVALWSLRRSPSHTGVRAWLGRRAPLEWVMIWLVSVAVVLAVTGALFRGPGWTLVWPAAAAE